MSSERKKVLKTLRDAGVKTFDVAAVNKLVDHVESERDPNEALTEFIRSWNLDGEKGDRLTLESVDSVLTQQRGGRQKVEVFAVVNAFTVPKISYDVVGKRLYPDNQPRSIFATAQAKHQLYLDRLNLINQRIRRSTLFQGRAFAGDTITKASQLTDISSIKSIIGERKFVVGSISRGDIWSTYVLEDAGGKVPLDLSAAQTAAGFYTENCIVIAEGMMGVDGTFHATALGFPLAEARAKLPMAAQRLNFFGGPPLSAEDEVRLAAESLAPGHKDDRLVILSNVHLDSREVLSALSTLFTGYNQLEQLPTLFILMGNFHSRAASSGMPASVALGADMDYAVMRDGFNALASLIEQFPRIRAESGFVFVPGPGDPSPSTALPQPPLPAYLTRELRRVLPNATFASNPCRIRYLAQEVVLFRYDILRRMRRHCIIPPRDLDLDGGEGAGAGAGTPAAAAAGAATQATRSAMWGHLSLTLLQQSHLCPLPLLEQPIYWQYDHALQLYPLPNVVVIADSSPQERHEHEGCVVFNPGSFSEGWFASYKPCSQEVEHNEVRRDGQTAEYEEEEQEQERGGGSPEGLGASGRGKGEAQRRHASPDVDALEDQDEAEAAQRREEAGASGAHAMECEADEQSPHAAAGAGSGSDLEEGHEAGSPDVEARASKRHSMRAPAADHDMWDAVVLNDQQQAQTATQAEVQ